MRGLMSLMQRKFEHIRPELERRFALEHPELAQKGDISEETHITETDAEQEPK